MCGVANIGGLIKCLKRGPESRIPGACGLIGIVNRKRSSISGKKVVEGLKSMQPRYNGLGAGFAAYGIYPKYRDCYALHLMFYMERSQALCEDYLTSKVEIVHDEPIPTRRVKAITDPPILWKYFVKVPERVIDGSKGADDRVIEVVMHINSELEDAFVMSSGKNMGVFKAVGYPTDVAEFYRIEEYNAYMWLGHGRYPTNTPGWWGGAHPFNILGWSVIHNGEVSSYGTNRRYVEEWGYRCTLMTDTEIFAYLFDLLVRCHKLPLEIACTAITPPFWKNIDNNGEEKRRLLQAIRITYAEALVNGPFSIIIATNHSMTGLIGLTDRIKLRPLVVAEKGPTTYIATEESAIRAICANPVSAWALKAGFPIIAKVEET